MVLCKLILIGYFLLEEMQGSLDRVPKVLHEALPRKWFWRLLFKGFVLLKEAMVDCFIHGRGKWESLIRPL